MKPQKTRKWKGPSLILRFEHEENAIREASASELSYPFVIGRRGTDGWVAPSDDKSVSGTHAEVYFRRGALWIRDLGSLNGIFIMGRRVKDAKLEPGLKVGIGNCRLVIEADHRSNEARVQQFHRLMRTNGSRAGTFFDLKEGTTKVGCGISDGLSCDSFLVSRHHADLICKPDDSCWIKDCGSRNGTLVNGTPLKKETERLLRDGDMVSFADCEFKFCDRNIPAPYPWVKMLFVALVTVSMFCGGYFFFQTLFPSAKKMLDDERQLELVENFDAALLMLDKVPDARGGDAFVDEVARRRANICVWKSTIDRWQLVQGSVEGRGWIVASKELGTLLSGGVDRWGWNTSTAKEKKRKAKVMKELLDVFLESHNVLKGEFAESDLGREKAVMTSCVQRMDDALGRKDWNDTLPTTAALREDMKSQRDAMNAVVSDLTAIETALSKIKRPTSGDIESVIKSASCFEATIRSLGEISHASEARNKAGAIEALNKKREFVSSDIVSRKCQAYLPSLQKMVETRNALLANCEALAALEYDKMQDLPLPSDSQTDILPVLVYIRDGMRRANERLVGPVRSNLKDQISRLEGHGITTNGIPGFITALLDKQRTNKAFLCDTLDPTTRPPSASRQERVGEYDTMFGMEELGAFIQNIEHERIMRPLGDKVRQDPLLIQALTAYKQLARFAQCCDSPEVKFLLRIDPPSGNKLRGIVRTMDDLRGKKSLLVDSWWGREGKDMRANLVAHAAALALDDGVSLDKEDVDEFVKERQAWKSAIEKLDKRIRADPFCVDEVRPKILTLAIPGMSIGNSTRHWADAAAREGR